MTSEPTTTSARRLRAGDRLGAQFVREFVCDDAFGERYEAVFGSTTHALDVCVPPAGAAAPAADDYRAFVARVSGVRHPCVVRYFAAGESAPRSGERPIPWLRGEHQEGAAASLFETALDPAGLPHDEDGPLVPTFGALLAASGGRLAPKDRDALLGDVLDGLAHLHSLGLPCGHFSPDEIALGHVRHHAEPLARIRVYAWSAGADPADLSADLVLAAPLFRAALDASQETTKPREAEGLALFAESLEAGVFATAADAAAAFAALCEKWGRPRAPRTGADDADGDDDAPAPAAGGERARPRRRHHAPSSGSGSEVMRRLLSLFRIFLVIAFIVGVGIAVYFYLSGEAEEERRRLAAMVGPPQPAILVIPTERPAEDRLAELPDDVFDYTADQLALAAGAEGDPRAPAAIARLALESLDAADEVDEAAFDEAAARIAPVLPALRKAADAEDPAASLLLGRALLLGLGTAQDVPKGYQRILKASLDGLREADLLFGDVLASNVRVPDLRAESRIERDRRAVAAWRRAAGPDAKPAPQLRRAADRIAPMLRGGRGIPPMNNDYPQWLGRIAAAGHVPSLVALSTPGGFASDDPAEALKWLRVLARTPGADPALRAWAQFRMGGMFERGEGTPASASAARKAYQRAAEGGNGEAMLALAEKLRKGSPADRAAAADWRKRAETAEPVPEIKLRTALVAPPASVAGRVQHEASPVGKHAPKHDAKPAPKHDAAKPTAPAGGANRAAAMPFAPRTSSARTPGDAPLVPLTDQPAAEPAGSQAEPPAKPAAKPAPKPAKKHVAP